MQQWKSLSSDEVFQKTYVQYREVEPSSGFNVIPRRACPGLAGLGPHNVYRLPKTYPHGGVRPCCQKATSITRCSSGPYVVHIWSCIPQNSRETKPLNST